jgi:hypothetical protein
MKDSYEKFADSALGEYRRMDSDSLFDRVKAQDVSEVRVSFALMITDLEYNDNWRVEPISRTKEFWEIANSGCCGSANTQVKCQSGNIYWIGCNYGH